MDNSNVPAGSQGSQPQFPNRGDASPNGGQPQKSSSINGCVLAALIGGGVVMFLVVALILLALLLPAVGMARARARQVQCADHQRQLFTAWSRANSRDPSHPVRGSQWNVRLGPYMEGSTKVFHCPDDVQRTQATSYGLNARAWRFSAPDTNRIVLLDYKDVEIQVVGQTLAQLSSSWPMQQAPRHFLKENVAFYDGHITPYECDKIDPRFCDYYVRYWRPARDSNIPLTGCVNSGEPPSSFPKSSP
ncbi:MAG: hypothetical protein K8T91_15020 [Planctomycetes bacterium]|nr:hypothetical protein [Planctomycetota bacterium]